MILFQKYIDICHFNHYYVSVDIRLYSFDHPFVLFGHYCVNFESKVKVVKF